MKRWWYSDLVRGTRLARCPALIWGIAAAAYLGLEFACRHFESPRGAFESLAPTNDPLRNMQTKAIDITAAVFGFYRAFALHPYARASYLKWLKTTCWQSGRALPLGPVTLTIGDVITLAVGMLLVWRADPHAWTLAVPSLFAATYLAGTACMLLFDGPRGFGYTVLVGLGGMLMVANRLEFALPIGVVTYVVAWLGTRRSLARLPMHEPRVTEKLASPTTSGVDRIEVRPLNAGWPFGPLCPQPSTMGVPRFDAVCISLVVGWVFLCAVTLIKGLFASGTVTEDAPWQFVALGPCTLACLIRMVSYLGAYRPPISLLGRIATGRWIIPGYDRALVAPLAGLLIVGATLLRSVSLSAQPSAYELPVLVTVVFLVLLLSGPTFRDWALTCECRIVARRPPQQQNHAATLSVSP